MKCDQIGLPLGKTGYSVLCPMLFVYGGSSFHASQVRGSSPMPAGCRDLVLSLYGPGEAEIYEPIIKEFEERTNLMGEGGTGVLPRKMTGRLENGGGNPDWDVVFGVGIETLEQTKEHWQEYKSPEAAFITDSFQCEDNRWTSLRPASGHHSAYNIMW